MTNTPYVKEFNDLGECTNPIDRVYLSESPNRQQRKLATKNQRFKGNKKGISLTVTNNSKYERAIQPILCKDGSVKHIEHYIAR